MNAILLIVGLSISLIIIVNLFYYLLYFQINKMEDRIMDRIDFQRKFR